MTPSTELSGLATRPISAAQQFRAVAYLRWCLFRNGFRRKGNAGEIVARIIVFPIAAAFVIGPMIGAGAAAYGATHAGHLEYLLPIYWVVFAIQILVSINISAPGLSFDPESLIRFPVTFPRYLTVRLFLGLLSASTVIGTMALFAAALGISLAQPALAVTAVAAAFALALCNMLFVRMVFAWIDRWLSTRRAREFFTFFIIAISVGIQYLNVTFNGFGRHGRHEQAAKIAAAERFYHHIQPVLAVFPPGLAASSIVAASLHAPTATALNLLGILLCAAAFLAVFAWRMQREYRGENLSEVNASPAATKSASKSTSTIQSAALPVLSFRSAAEESAFGTTSAPGSQVIAESRPAMSRSTSELPPAAKPSLLSPEVLTAMAKEWIYVRRNPSQFYGLILPLGMVFLYAARMNTVGRTSYVFPGAVCYSLLGLSAQAYNSLGLDGPGVQFYFLSPVRMRTIFLAKNLFGFLINLIQVTAVYVLLAFTSGAPPPLIVADTILWAIFAALVNITVGNMRSITAPKKIDPQKISRKQASQLSALLSVGLMLTCGAIGAGLIALGHFTAMPWLPIPILLVFDFGALALYLASLRRLDSLVQNNRETLLEELTKVSV